MKNLLEQTELEMAELIRLLVTGKELEERYLRTLAETVLALAELEERRLQSEEQLKLLEVRRIDLERMWKEHTAAAMVN